MKLKPLISRFTEEPGYLLKFIKKNIIFSFSKRNSSPILKTLSIVPTYKCDMNCLMCGNWRSLDTTKDDNKIDMDEYKSIIDEVAKYDCNIALTGGDPLFYSHWHKLSKYIKNKNLRLDLQTNGWLLEEFAGKVVDVIDNLNISIDGTKEIHNKIRKKGSFEKTISGIKKVDEIKMTKKKKKPYIVIIYTISDINYEYLCSTVEYLNNLNIDIDTVLFIHQMFISQEVKDEYLKKFGNIFNMSKVFSGFTHIPEKINTNKLKREIEKVKILSKKVHFNINFLPSLKGEDIKIYYEGSDIFPKVAPKICITPFTEAFILPSGEVWICPLNVVGNIKEEKFSSLWEGEKARELREQLIKDGNFRICKNCCGLYA